MNISNKLRNIFHHTLSMFLHYHGKVNSSNLLQILKRGRNDQATTVTTHILSRHSCSDRNVWRFYHI